MNLHEFQAKELLSRFGIKVPRGRIADNAADAERIAQRLSFQRYAVKAQVQASDRFANGGVRFATSPSGVRETVSLLLATTFTRAGGPVGGERVRWVLIEEALAPMQMLYAAVYLDPARGALSMLASAAGGSAIEQRSAADPSMVSRVPISITGDRAIADFSALARGIGLAGPVAEKAALVFASMADIAVKLDALQVEINPLALTYDGDLVALDAKIRIDDNAMFRHPAFAAMSSAVEVEEGDPVVLGADRHHINYQRMHGDIGVVVNGAGLALATLDAVVDAGGSAANFMDVRTTATSLDVAYGLELILANPSARAILVNIHGGGMQPCDTIAEGIGVAMRRAARRPPLVIRMAGNNYEFAHKVLGNNGIAYSHAADIGAAARMAVAAARSNV